METSTSNRKFLGMLFLILGGILLLRFMNILPFNIPYYFFSWKTILIALGVLLIFTERSKTTGIILFSIGAIFLARDIFRVDFRDMMQVAIPVLLLVVGLVFLMPRRSRPKRDYSAVSNQDVAGNLDEVNIFAGGNKFIHSDNFQGGEITCIFGGTELNFRHADLSAGNNVLDVTCIFGGCTLYVPEDWTVRIDTSNIFAGFTDSRYKKNVGLATNPDKVLYIKGVLIFGGGEIKTA